MKRTDENHSFSIHVATILKGHVQKAILLKEIYGWVNINAGKKINIKHGIVWTYMSSSGFAKKFPYMGEPSIRRWMISLEKDGWLYSGKFNKKAYDKTKWYTININKYDDAVLSKNHTVDQNNQWVDQFDQWIVQNNQSFVQIDQWIAQSNQPIPSPTQLLPTNNNSIEEKAKIKDLEIDNEKLQKELAEIKKMLEDASKPKKKTRKKFVPPTIEQATEDFIKKGSNKNEAEKFINHYASKGWMVGKTKMVSWKHSVNGWIGRNKPPQQTKNLVVDTYPLPPALQKMYEKGLAGYNAKEVAQRITYFTKQEFEAWMKGGVNFEKYRNRGILTEQKIYKKISETISKLNTDSFYTKKTGNLIDYVNRSFEGKVKQIG